MRELAQESGVAPKTLYHQFGSKERLLITAVEERFRDIYQQIDEARFEHGIDRLFYIIDTVADTTRRNLEYGRALAPLLSSDSESPIGSIRRGVYRRAVIEIAAEKDFLAWVDAELMVSIIYQQMIAISQARWYEGDKPKRPTFNLAKLDVCLILRATTRGYTHEKVTAFAETAQAEFRKARGY